MPLSKNEELRYLVGIISEASKWKVDDGDDAVRLEVNYRIEQLLQEDEPPRKGESHAGKLNVSYKGKKRWVPEDWVQKVPYAASPTGFKYEPVDEYRAEFLAKFGLSEVDNALP